MAPLTENQEKLQAVDTEIEGLKSQIGECEVLYRGYTALELDFKNGGQIIPPLVGDATTRVSMQIKELKTRFNQLEDQRKTLRNSCSFETCMRKDNGVGGIAIGRVNDMKRAAPDDFSVEMAKRFRTFQGHSGTTLVERFRASVPSDEVRKSVRVLRNQTLDQSGRVAREDYLVDFLTPLFQDGTLALGRNIELNDHGELAFLKSDDPMCTKSKGLAYPSVPKDAKNTLDEVVALLTNQSTKSISHLPNQMGRLAAKTGEGLKAHALFDALIESVRDLQMDSTIIGQQGIAMHYGTCSDEGTHHFLKALDNTHEIPELQDIYRTHKGGSEEIQRCLTNGVEVAGKIMTMRLLRSSLVLAKFTCLATCLAVAIAPKFGRGVCGREANDALKDSTLGGLLQHQVKLLEVFGEFKTKSSDLPSSVDCTAQYNPDNEIHSILENALISKRLGVMGQDKAIGRQLVLFLNSGEMN